LARKLESSYNCAGGTGSLRSCKRARKNERKKASNERERKGRYGAGRRTRHERRKALLSKYVNQLLYVAVQIVHQFDSRGYSDEIN